MKFNQILEFRKDLYFEGAVQSDWYYNEEKSKIVAENFVFHGKTYYGVENNLGSKRIDTISFVKEIGKKLNDDGLNPLSLAIADYGTGKSHLAVTLAHLLSGPTYLPATYKAIVDNIRKIDVEEASTIESLFNTKNFVLVLNGMKDFNLHSELLKAAQKTLRLHGLSDDKLRKINRSIETAEVFFDRNSTLFLDSFEKAAKKHGWNETGDLLINRIKLELLSNEIAFEIINEVYSSTTGHSIRWDEGLSATNILEELVSDYCGINGEFDSVIILFDEFGRYLEYASGVDSGKSGDSALQQIFECSQNLDGRLQVINFIQSDIKTYLQRVDNTKNISRYIGRYDISDKYYISSNLETVFANLIHRKDLKLFNQFVVSKQNELEKEWEQVFEYINKWSTTTGLWAEYNLFRKVIVEGIYPIHPLATFMLSQLSDYLQNRSSLTLISYYINDMSNYELTDDYYVVLPEKLMTGDLFVEMLSAEQEGKQSSQHCIRYYNILRKYEDKLSENHLKVLRSNLVLRILRFRTGSYEEVLKGLQICSGLSNEDVTLAIEYLEKEYGILGYDDRACCFDFMEESNGAHDYKIIKRRILASAVFDPFLLRNNQEILQLTEADTNIDTDFGVKHRITSIEWQFKQQLYCAEDITEKLIDNYLNEWINSTEPDTPKGQLIWIYVCKDTSQDTMIKIQNLSRRVEGTPIYLMLLNDIDNRLNNDLIEFSVLKNLDDEIKRKYERHFQDDVSQNINRIKAEFNNLKKQRLYFTREGIVCFENRLSRELSASFEQIYPNVVSFNYDGLITTKKNIAPKSTKNFFTIVQMLLTNSMDSDSIHNQQIEIRNRIDGLLYTKSATSWKCLNENYHMVPPENESARYVYDLLVNRFMANEEIKCKDIYEFLTRPPFGFNTYSFILMIAVILSNLDYCLRIRINNKLHSVKAWRQLIFVKEGKIEFDNFLNSVIVKVDAGVTEEKFIKMFKQIEDNTDIDIVSQLEEELEQLIEENDVPERLKDALLLAKKELLDGKNIKRDWTTFTKKLNEFKGQMTVKNLYPGLQAIELIHKTDVLNMFEKYNYKFTDYYKNQLVSIKLEIEDYIESNFDQHLNLTRCNEIERLVQYKNHGRKMVAMFNDLGYKEYANDLSMHISVEIENVEKIKEKQNLKDDCYSFIKKCKINQYTTLVELKEYETTCQNLIELYNQYAKFLGRDSVAIQKGLFSAIEKINKEKEKIVEEIGSIFDDVYELKDYHAISVLVNRCEMIQKRGLTPQDKESIDSLHHDLLVLLDDVKVFDTISEDRGKTDEYSTELLDKYDLSETEITIEVIENIVKFYKDKLDEKEKQWKNSYITFSSEKANDIYNWMAATKVLPAFLSSETIDVYNENLKVAKKIVSKNRISTAKYYYDLLTDEEKDSFKLMIKN